MRRSSRRWIEANEVSDFAREIHNLTLQCVPEPMPYFAGLLRTLLGMTDRAFENKFADYDGSSDVILPDGKVRQHFGTPFKRAAETAVIIAAALFQFTHKFEQDVRKHLLELVAVLEKNLDKHTDWNDASVYTGTTGVEGSSAK